MVLLRLTANILVGLVLASSAYVIHLVVEYDRTRKQDPSVSWWKQNLVDI